MKMNTFLSLNWNFLICFLLTSWTIGLTLSLAGCSTKQPATESVAHEQAPDDEIKLTIVYDNYPGAPELTPSWGFACVVEGLEKTILFDTGADGRIFMENFRQLNFDPRQIDLVVISHLHSDHTSGLEPFLQAHPGLPVYLPDGSPESFLQQLAQNAQPIIANESAELCPGARTTGTLDHDAIPEHALCIKTADGWILLTGCAHPGVENLAETAQNITPEPVYMALGGFHMNAYPTDKINAVIDKLQKVGMTHAAPTHCTGDLARHIFKQRLGPNCTLPHLGYVFRFPKSP